MGIKETKKIFSIISRDLTAETIGKNLQSGNKDCLLIKGDLPAFECLDLLEKYPCLKTENGIEITRAEMMNKPIKILFYVLSADIEYALYKVIKAYSKSSDESEKLKEYFLNDLIREFFKLDGVLKLQSIYKKRSEMKEDLKAFSSFRNIIMHANSKIQLETEFRVIVERKRQMLKLLDSFEQIRESLEK
jgi:hypothetical protein